VTLASKVGRLASKCVVVPNEVYISYNWRWKKEREKRRKRSSVNYGYLVHT
jgi:hypothetical protein